MTTERSRGENQERENNPDQAAVAVLNEAVSNAEVKEAVENNPVPPSVKKAKEYFKEGSKYALSTGSVIFQTVWGLISGLFKLAKEAVVKKGNVGYNRGKEIGKESSLIDDKKDKK